MDPETIRVLLDVVGRLDRLGIRYVIGGSLASSTHGEFRASADADLLIELPYDRVKDLVSAFETEFYVSMAAATEAVTHHRSFNLIHLGTLFKVDLFVKGSRRLNESQMGRRVQTSVGTPPATVFMSSPEDTILCKLDWYRKGGHVSAIQWRDVLGVLKQQGSRLDLVLLRDIAQTEGLSELLERALREAGLATTP